MNARLTGIFMAILMLASAVTVPCASADTEEEPDYLLLDWGNGATEWLAIGGSGSYRDIASFVLSYNGHSVSFDGGITVDGRGTTVVGGEDTGGSLIASGTTGVTVTSYWHMFVWDPEASEWTALADPDEQYVSGHFAIGHYPDGLFPVETPEFMSSWTTVGGDSELSFNQSAKLNRDDGTEVWRYTTGEDSRYSGVYGSVLYVQGYSIVTFGDRNLAKPYDLMVCFDSVGSIVWEFRYDSQMFDTSTSAIYGDRIYIPSSYGYIYSFDWRIGPGDPVSTDSNLGYIYEDVKTFNGASMADGSVDPVPTEIEELEGNPYGGSFSSIVYDSGCLFVKHRNGMVYCFDTDLNLVWSFLSGGYCYFTAPTVAEGYVFAGFYDGRLYALDETTGTLLDSIDVYREATVYVGSVGGVNVLKTDAGLALFVMYDDGKGMSSMNYGYAVFSFDGSEITLVKDFGKQFGETTRYGTVVRTDGFEGVYVVGSKGMFAVDAGGNASLVSTKLSTNNNAPHAPLIFVNGSYFFVEAYSKLVSKIFVLNLDGEILKELSVPVENYCMAPVTVVDGLVIGGNDGGAYCYTAIVDDYNPPSPPVSAAERAETILYWGAGIAVVVAALFIALRFGLGWEHPFAHIRNSVHRFLYGEDYTHSVRKKHRLWLILLGGFSVTFCIALASLCIGPDYVMSIPSALGAGWSAICKGGQSLTYEEMLIYNSRLPRTIAAFAAGIGLSVAGAVYQAVIRNPLVEPYIMGVSSGAGTLAVAVMVFGFTFFGLFPVGSPYLTVVAAMVGGLLAFGLTMLLALKTGGKSINYVLSGIVIGLVFSAVQSIMMVSAGKDIASALSWLYGSFASMDWDKVWLVLVPVLALSAVPMVWAKELNLVLLGEDQARQMGLDARRFNSFMLILASILTAFCVAFCGIIGFVGLVVPHLCRMVVGGDHRLVLPATFAFGGLLMILADLVSRAVIPGYELPVGAITTIIGVPMFAYLLVKRGKNYE